VARAVNHSELELLQEEDPTAEFARGGFLTEEQPFEGTVVDDELEWAAKDVATEFVDAVDDSEAFQFGDRVVAFSRGEASRREGNGDPLVIDAL